MQQTEIVTEGDTKAIVCLPTFLFVFDLTFNFAIQLTGY